MCPEEGNRDERYVLWGVAGDSGVVQFGEMEAKWQSHYCLQLPEEGNWKEVISSPWYPVIGHLGVVQSCIKGGSGWTLGSIFLLRGLSNIGTRFLERLSTGFTPVSIQQVSPVSTSKNGYTRLYKSNSLNFTHLWLLNWSSQPALKQVISCPTQAIRHLSLDTFSLLPQVA